MRKLMFLAIPAMLVAGGVAWAENNTDTFRLLNLFGDVFERVRTDYVEEVTDDKLIESAVNGMLTALDPHSSYLSEKAFKEMQVQTKGEFGGLGIEVTMENGLVKVVSPIDDTPAAKAGMQPGDLITHIDDDPVMGFTLSEAVEKLRGPVGMPVKLKVMRQGVTDPVDVEIVRAVIRIRSVRSENKKDIAYIRITSFSEQTYEGVKAEFEKLEKEIGKDLKGIVLDLRNNPGGLLDQAIEVSDAFLDDGEIVSTRGRTPESTRRYNARKGDIAHGLPIVVLINGGSASASEIVSGALQDHKRAIIMGTQSFGKGSVQTVIPLPGHGAMRLTTSRYYTPSGISIQAEGIKPDIEVDIARVEVVKAEEDRMRKEANLPGRLDNPNKKNKESKPSTETPVLEKTEDKAEAEKGTMEDYQLARALDLLRGIAYYQNVEKK